MTTKQKVFELLSKNTGSYVSGEKLAQDCGVSRAAIWKAVQAIRDDGFVVEGTNNNGYTLSVDLEADVLSQTMIEYELTQAYPEFAASHIECFETIDSTNTYAKKLMSENAADIRKIDHAIIAAESQTAGRGRLGRTFVSPEKTGLYISLILSPEKGITNPSLITAFAAVAVCRAITELYKIQPKIKWINDLYLQYPDRLKKVVGILTEGFTNFETGRIDSAVIGIGVNIKSSKQISKSEAGQIAGFIEDVLPEDSHAPKITRARLAAEIAGQVFKIFEEPQAKVIAEYKSLMFMLGQTLTVHPLIGDDKSAYTAKALDIDENAGLVVELADGSKKTLSSGEVSLHSQRI